MTRSENHIEPADAALLRDLLHRIAENPQLPHITPSVLEASCSLIEAEAGFYLVFDEPRYIHLHGITENYVPDDNILRKYANDFGVGVHQNSTLPDGLDSTYSSWVFAPVFKKKEVVGTLCLFLNASGDMPEDRVETLRGLLDGLAIVTLNAKAAEQHNKMTQNQNEFVRVVSHDLRSPLTSIKGFASMLEANPGSEFTDKHLHFVEKILSGVGQMTSLVDNIQDAGRYDPETGFYEMQRAPTDLVMIVQNIVKNHLVPAEKEALTLIVNAQPDIPIVNVDAGMIERSIINLVDNAIKYTPNGGEIEVGVHKEDNHIVIRISDDGYGISEENRKHLFQRHFRIRRREHKRIKGSGLGLFIVRSVARHHGGDAFVESTEGEGSTFGIRIPLEGENLLGSGSRTESD